MPTCECSWPNHPKGTSRRCAFTMFAILLCKEVARSPEQKPGQLFQVLKRRAFTKQETILPRQRQHSIAGTMYHRPRSVRPLRVKIFKNRAKTLLLVSRPGLSISDMTRTLNSFPFESSEAEANHAFNVLIAYQNLE